MIAVSIIPILEDNYSYILEADNGDVAVVDPGDAAPIIAALDQHGLKPSFIFNTHHHGDHIAGNAEIKARYGAQIAGPAFEEARIRNMDILLSEKSEISFGGEDVQIIETPGHTRGHICFFFTQSKIVFTGDTLFSLSCGRVFEGTADQMWQSLQKLMALPDETRLYCGHEYTQSNGEFGLTLEPDNTDLRARMNEVNALRAAGKPTLPSTIGLEKKTNVFLRAGSAQKFVEIRKLKDET